jgi:hypothetical protein
MGTVLSDNPSGFDNDSSGKEFYAESFGDICRIVLGDLYVLTKHMYGDAVFLRFKRKARATLQKTPSDFDTGKDPSKMLKKQMEIVQ